MGELGLICEVIRLLSPSSEKNHLILQNEAFMLSTLLDSLIYCISKSNLMSHATSQYGFHFLTKVSQQLGI